MKLWKINCMEGKYPGLWQRWLKYQCVAVGFRPFPPQPNHLEGPTGRLGWSKTRNALKAIKADDWIVVALHGNRVGRIGQVTGKRVEDKQWDPLVSAGASGERHGQMGRRILVRWDMAIGPNDRDQVVVLPERSRFNRGELRPTLCEIHSLTLKQLQAAMNNPSNWDGLLTRFDYEKALEGYIAAYPHLLEDGLLPHPDIKIRQNVFKDQSRTDVILIDCNERPVIVEAKRGAPSPADVSQLRKYMRRLAQKTGRKPRGILVHGGALKLSSAVREEAGKKPPVEIVKYTLEVKFGLCA
jgi:hypothetical protein